MLEGIFKTDKIKKAEKDLKRDQVNSQVMDIVDTLNSQIESLEEDRQELDELQNKINTIKGTIDLRIDNYQDALEKLEEFF
ncbi:MAG: hypothetical protein ACOC4M_10165 [Promethearchaeia archaeon]